MTGRIGLQVKKCFGHRATLVMTSGGTHAHLVTLEQFVTAATVIANVLGCRESKEARAAKAQLRGER
jgi:hypothetical protein